MSRLIRTMLPVSPVQMAPAPIVSIDTGKPNLIASPTSLAAAPYGGS